MTLKQLINEDMKQAMKARDSVRLSAIRLLMAAIKQKEVDERIELDDTGVVAVIDKMIKQRRDSVAQYQAGGRADLADAERAEITVLSAYMPKQLDEAEILPLLEAAIAATGAAGMQDMGKVMAVLRPQLAGRADMAVVSALIKGRLTR